jgi:hypothetical protein
MWLFSSTALVAVTTFVTAITGRRADSQRRARKNEQAKELLHGDLQVEAFARSTAKIPFQRVNIQSPKPSCIAGCAIQNANFVAQGHRGGVLAPTDMGAHSRERCSKTHLSPQIPNAEACEIASPIIIYGGAVLSLLEVSAPVPQAPHGSGCAEDAPTPPVPKIASRAKTSRISFTTLCTPAPWLMRPVVPRWHKRRMRAAKSAALAAHGAFPLPPRAPRHAKSQENIDWVANGLLCRRLENEMPD